MHRYCVWKTAQMPLTLAVLRAYEQFRGDSDGWCRSAQGRLNPAGADDWPLIDEIVMKLRSAASGLASQAFMNELNHQIKTEVCHPDVVEELRRVAEVSARW